MYKPIPVHIPTGTCTYHITEWLLIGMTITI